MKKNSKCEPHLPSDFLDKLHSYEASGLIPTKVALTIEQFFRSYLQALQEHHLDVSKHIGIFFEYLECIRGHLEKPTVFSSYHKMVRAPYDYHRFGIDFITPLIHFDKSTILGKNHLQQIYEHIQKGHNVILFANHQIEADPQVIYALLTTACKALIPHLIFVAGERVLIDPIAVPFSLGCNLLCIYSKRYIDHPPEQKSDKQHHNNRTMKRMKALLDEGGHCIYVAPSGGRDRPDSQGTIHPAPFDAQSIEMFYLMARHSATPTFFYPLALSTYQILPPPQTVQKELGEHRKTQASAVHLYFGSAISMESFPGSDTQDKHLRRKARADYIYDLVCQGYDQFP